MILRAALLLTAAAGVPAGRTTIGIYQGWGAFRDQAPARCFAIARPIVAGGRTGGYAGVASWPGRGLAGSFHVRLSRPRSADAPVTLAIGERRFALAAAAADAWAADAPSDRALVAAMRSGRSMSVETVAANGRAFADTYALAGAATAIDAAALACAVRTGGR